MPRHKAEEDSRYKQIITYSVLIHQNLAFLYQRIKASSEKRLMLKYSLGLGGHINPVSVKNFKKVVTLNLIRELSEEVFFEGPYSYRFIGIVNDEETEVGKYHLGFVFLVLCSSPKVEIKEKEKLTGDFIPVSRLISYQPYLETWSSLVLPEIKRMISYKLGRRKK
ncbi:MAG: hypothetical protein QHH75_13370 [Bacillota bacterium]|nr:hypothetical protein [Bacillota bacterium]